jgi:hypothetical protein
MPALFLYAFESSTLLQIEVKLKLRRTGLNTLGYSLKKDIGRSK